ncbi:hypothetical protein CQK57_03580 [Salmonella enterica]|uniref:PerC family transcriptional regulator n=2 Tax=Salmonella enterica TaxID=28901 RepID=A0A747PNS8_SALER|nr:hypothetical protein [Salmonella enterica]EBG8067334.1 hypothetical protein [Salmonella enterica subsp. enterica serovar Elisabethville]EBU8203406.1 hypothetical protein [Salmonella enterica subsp. enterica serovar Cardoner]EBV3389077.1 hypothetical protein [Salmonella enterica subsp. enterica serovar Virchow]EBW3367845.1 hypothetical protein [Salmonella enterica subsp. enterica serovar Wangata]EBX4202684.1 hypothetical protein [Salmonella enterica subsp. enterica serovar Oakland]ECD296843
MMSKPGKELIANFVYYNPRSPLSVITDITGFSNDCACSRVLCELVREGKVIREKSGKKSVFTAAPGYIPSDAVYAVSPDYNHDEIQKLEEQIATLESLGLWRRAQTLLTRLSSMQNTAAGVTAIAHRRNATVRVINATRSRPHSAW